MRWLISFILSTFIIMPRPLAAADDGGVPFPVVAMPSALLLKIFTEYLTPPDRHAFCQGLVPGLSDGLEEMPNSRQQSQKVIYFKVLGAGRDASFFLQALLADCFNAFSSNQKIHFRSLNSSADPDAHKQLCRRALKMIKETIRDRRALQEHTIGPSVVEAAIISIFDDELFQRYTDLDKHWLEFQKTRRANGIGKFLAHAGVASVPVSLVTMLSVAAGIGAAPIAFILGASAMQVASFAHRYLRFDAADESPETAPAELINLQICCIIIHERILQLAQSEH